MLCKNPIAGQFGCGQCNPCRFNLRRIWASRIMLEARLHEKKSFLTLTYSKEKVPKKDGLHVLAFDDLRDFWKRLRNEFPPHSVRYYAVGEYGHSGDGMVDASGQQWNPHYHAALYGVQCLGKIQRLETGVRCYCNVCELVLKKWPFGNVTLDELNDITADYTAGYVVKKMTSPDDIRLAGRPPEASRQSQGIARGMIKDLADALLSEFGYLAFQLGDVPPSLRYNGKNIPLGRYLRSKLRREIGLEKINPETGEVTYGAPYETIRQLLEKQNPEVSALQEAIRNAPFGEKKDLYPLLDTARERSVSDHGQKIKNFETRQKIYHSKRTKKL